MPFISYILTDHDVCMNLVKVQAIKEMPLPEDMAAVQKLLSLVDITKPLQK